LCQFIVRSGKSTYLVNAQKLSTVTYITILLSVSSILPVPISDMLNNYAVHRFCVQSSNSNRRIKKVSKLQHLE